MAKFRWIKTSLLLILVLQFTATLGQYTFFIVRDGDKVTLPCSDVTEDQDECNDITWSFGTKDLPEDLFLFGKINENTKSDRLSVTANCSLVIKKVTAEDAGQYICQHQSVRNQVYLSVVTMTEQKDNKEVTLHCSVSPYEECEHTVKWLYVDKDNKDMMTSPSDCSASVTTSLSESKHHEFFKCAVTDDLSRNTMQFIYLDSDKKTGEDEKTSTSKPTTATKPPATATKPPATTTASEDTTTVSATVATTTASATNDASTKGWWLRFLIVSVGLSVLIISVVAVNMWTRTEEKKTQMDEITVRYDEDDGTVNYENIRPSDGV